MQIVYLLLSYFLLGGACLYLVFCADPHGKGPISFVRRLLFDKFPNAFKYSSLKFDSHCSDRTYGEKVVGQKVIALIGQSINYICWKNHPLIQVGSHIDEKMKFILSDILHCCCSWWFRALCAIRVYGLLAKQRTEQSASLRWNCLRVNLLLDLL